ncbi:peroxisomal succinyl-coenzyme A thioesterase-like, partial [Plectropomus leopardus]|uniref:peroxisomal succinyl-coenzyme A thioesterase-like n=1 Tax=Plectropomus leopardus TaxID=160734 RepID=UPI001C4C89BE
IPPGPGPFPGLLDMWGAGGGLIEYRSSLLASHGYASLALEYFAASEMESANIEFSYFETAFSIVRDHPQVMADRVGILGLSLGTAVAILLAAESSAVKPRCCVCISGSHFYPPGATLKDIFHILVRNAPKIRVDEDNCEIWRDMVLPITEDFSLKVD